MTPSSHAALIVRHQNIRWSHGEFKQRVDALAAAFLSGRLKDMLIRGGENIYPREVEEFLYRHPNTRFPAMSGLSANSR